MRIFFLITSLLLTTSSSALACKHVATPSNSIEPVTIKVADTYFMIPEGYIEYSFLRVPMERKYLGLYVPAKIIFPKITTLKNKDRKLSIGIFAITEEVRSNTIQLNDKIKIAFSEVVMTTGKEVSIVDDNEVIKYIKSISSKKEPGSWKKDNELAKKFQLGEDPCEVLVLGASEQNKAESIEISYQDILDGLAHRNEAIRGAAAYKAGDVDSSHKKDISSRLQDIIHNDKSDNVKRDADRGLAKLNNN